MRKTIKVFIVALLMLFIVSCKTKEELVDFSKAFKDYKYSETTGHRYKKIQRLGNIIVYEETVETLINKSDVLKAKTSYYEKKLSEFDSEQQFIETRKEKYYYKDSIGKNIEGELAWEKGSFSEFNEEVSLPSFIFKKEYFKDHDLTRLADYLLLKAHLKDEHTKDFFLIDEEIKDVYIEVRIREKKLQEFKIVYTLDKTTVETSYRIFFDEHELDINY